MHFVDTNIFIRFLTKDDPKKSEACFNLFKKCKDGKLNLQTTESVIAEVVYVLMSPRLYNLKKPEIYELLLPILTINSLKITSKSFIIKGLEMFAEKNIDFEDAILASCALKSESGKVFSYDKDFDKINGIKRLEP